MSEIIIGPGDAVSRLVQLHAQRFGVRMTWVGKGPEDIDLLCAGYSNKMLLNECLWNGLRELMAMAELKELPEPVQAKIMSIILKAQAVFELKIVERNHKKEPKT
jgi:hypothetical protein